MREADLTPMRYAPPHPPDPLLPRDGEGGESSPLPLVGEGQGVRGSSAFSLMELLIVLSITAILTVPFVGIYILPLRTHANLAELTKTSLALQKLDAHLSDDVRCADALEVRTDADGKSALVIQRGPEKVIYRTTEGGVVRITDAAIPLEFHFSSIRAEFTIRAGGVYRILHARLTATYNLLKGNVERIEERAYCSHLEGGS